MIHVFISDGRLFIRTENGVLKEIESHFVRDKIDSAEYKKAYGGWKGTASGDNPYWGSNVVWGGQASAGSMAAFRFKDVVIADAETVYYTLANNVITGLFRYDVADDDELRLFHRNEFSEMGFDYSAANDEFVMAVEDEDGRANLQLLDSRGSFKDEITAGDSRDSYPVFSKSTGGSILFQSAGIARDEDGFAMAFAPEVIKKLDIVQGEMTDIAGDDQFDYLLPRDDAMGNIYCIRRPYKAVGHVSPFRVIWDILFFPFRFLMAIVYFLKAFTELFNRKAMRPDGPQVQARQQNKYVRVLGRTIDLARIQRNTRDAENASLVPGSWELIKISPEGNIEKIARNVSSYDIDDEGNVHLTNGYRVKEIGDSGTVTAFKHNIIENIKVTSHVCRNSG